MALFNFLDGPVYDVKLLISKWKNGKWVSGLSCYELRELSDQLRNRIWQDNTSESLLLCDLVFDEMRKRRREGRYWVVD